MTFVDCVVGLGTNLGDRRRILSQAIEILAARTQLVATSRLYESAPVGPPQPDFLNAAVRLVVPSAPEAALGILLAVERVFGRRRGERWGPRTLDLDLLWADGLVVDRSGLTVPHPELTRRAFALRPLLDVAPHARDPRTGRPLADAMAALDGAPLREVPAPWRVGRVVDGAPGAERSGGSVAAVPRR